MKIFKPIIYLLFAFFTQLCFAQYEFDGYVNDALKNGKIYLSVIEDYRKISGVYPEQILTKVLPDSSGFFQFKGNNLPLQNRMYRIHMDTCFEEEQDFTHFSGQCLNSKEIIFIANNTSTLSFPFSFDMEMFCKIESNTEKATLFLKIDSLKNDMRYAFGTYRSEANRKINSKKWFTTFQNYGEQLEEPLAELYMYSFLSDRRNNLYDYYLKDVKENSYYEDLLKRLQEKYPDSNYVQQYENEIKSDLFLVNHDSEKTISWWVYVFGFILFLSILMNFFLFKRNNILKEESFSKEKLTSQEQKTLDLILEDKTNKDIASELFISVSTVKTHINNLYKKLNVTSREEVKT